MATAEANATRRDRPPRAEQAIDEESPADTSDVVQKDASPAWQSIKMEAVRGQQCV